MIYFLDLFGVTVFAVSGALAAGRKQMDLFGVVVLGMVTALGGGTVRDVILDVRHVFWIADHTYVFVALVAALVTFLAARSRKPSWTMLLVPDAIGLAMFTVIGADKALSLGVPAVVAVMMGVITAVAGGMMRDILSGEIPLILRREIYATASLSGAVVFVCLFKLGVNVDICSIAGIAVTLALRLAAIRWKLSLPRLFVR